MVDAHEDPDKSGDFLEEDANDMKYEDLKSQI